MYSPVAVLNGCTHNHLCRITDAYNNARDRVRYLESLSPHLEPLEASPPPNPANVLSCTLPALAAAFRQMDGLSRVYARSGYLGVLLTKVHTHKHTHTHTHTYILYPYNMRKILTIACSISYMVTDCLCVLMQISNSLINVCISHVDSYSTKQGKDHDHFWALLSEAILSEMHKPPSSPTSTQAKDHKLISILNSCLELSTAFREFVQRLRDTFLLPGPIYTSTGGTSAHRGSSTSTATHHHTLQKSQLSTRNLYSGANSANKSSSTPTGIALSDIDQITRELMDFRVRVSKVLDIVSTIAQFRQLNMHGKLEGLPRVGGLWELSLPEGCDEQPASGSQTRSIDTSKRTSPDIHEAKSKVGSDGSDINLATPDFLEQLLKHKTAPGSVVSQPLSTLKEESLVGSDKSLASRPNDKGDYLFLSLDIVL